MTTPRDVLHVTNGDVAADVIRRAGLPGEILPWRDVLHEGPVPEGASLDGLRPVRARFIAGAGWGALDDVLAQFEARDRALEESLAFREVVLWFEHDLYDQLQLLQLLDWFAARELGDTRLALICGAEYLGPSSPDRLAGRFPARQPVSAAQLATARAGWAAFRSADPRPLAELLRQDTSALPFVRGAMLRHLQQFPAEVTGLSRSEAQALDAMSRGVTRVGDVYRASHHECEEAVFLGDVVFAWYLAELGRGSAPLIAAADGGRLPAPAERGDPRDFWSTHVALTAMGRDVLHGRADRVTANGIDRWLGGVHLQGRSVRWRWDDGASRVQEHAA